MLHWRLGFEMFHLDYLSCCLTVLAAMLLARKSWIGLPIAIANSLIVCAIALRTSQLGFIPANLFCVCMYASSMRSWFREETRTHQDEDGRMVSQTAHSHTVEVVGASHSVYVSHAKEVADVIDSAARAVGK